MQKRRSFLQGLLAGFPAIFAASGRVSAEGSFASAGASADRDIFAELGVPSFVNAAGPYSTLSGAEMWPEVIEAMLYAQKHNARIGDVHDAVGERIASLTGAEAAMVPAGATSGMILGTAACLTGTDIEKILSVPDLRGMKSEVIFQRGQDYSYVRALRNTGVKVVLVETERELEEAVNEETAMLHFAYAYRDRGEIDAARFVALGKKHGIPVFCDAATVIPPVSNIERIVKIGFDLVCFSGGKGLRGPYNGGLLLGRKDLIAAARMSAAPNDEGIGRGMKVSKEVIVGVLVALETSLRFDEEADKKKRISWLRHIGDEVEKLGGIETELVTSQGEFYPNLRFTWDPSKYKATPEDVKQALRDGEPAIETVSLGLSKGNFEVSTWSMREGEEAIVADRLREVLEAAS